MEFKEMVKDTLNRQNIVVLYRKQNGGIEAIASEQSQHEEMGIMFSAVFLLIAVMGIVTTMTRMTSNQRIQIGTLKALGFSKRKITWHYMSYGIVISSLGSIVGGIGVFVSATAFPAEHECILHPAQLGDTDVSKDLLCNCTGYSGLYTGQLPGMP